MNILVIGGSGFIGTRLVDELLEANHTVRILDINHSQKYPELTDLGDVRTVNDIIKVSEKMDVIYNLAAEHRDDVTPLSLYHDVNVEGARNVVRAAEINNVKSIVFTSTVAIYGLNKDCPDETFPAEPFNEYGRTKWEAEKIFNAWANSDATRNLTIVRPAVVFGEGNRGNVYNLISQINSGRFVMIGNGKNKKSMGYVGNIADFLCIQTKNEGKIVFNFCDKPDLTSAEIANTISQSLGKKLPGIGLPLSIGILAGTSLDLVAAITKKKFPISAVRIRKFASETTVSTKALLDSGYSAKYTLKQGLERMINAEFTQENRL